MYRRAEGANKRHDLHKSTVRMNNYTVSFSKIQAQLFENWHFPSSSYQQMSDFIKQQLESPK